MQRALDDLRYLFPERYANVPKYDWHAGTIADVAEQIERALSQAPAAQTCAARRTAGR